MTKKILCESSSRCGKTVFGSKRNKLKEILENIPYRHYTNPQKILIQSKTLNCSDFVKDNELDALRYLFEKGIISEKELIKIIKK